MARIVERGRLRVGVDQNTYLFGFRDPHTGDLTGFDIDLAREIARAFSAIPTGSSWSPSAPPTASPRSNPAKWTSSSAP